MVCTTTFGKSCTKEARKTLQLHLPPSGFAHKPKVVFFRKSKEVLIKDFHMYDGPMAHVNGGIFSQAKLKVDGYDLAFFNTLITHEDRERSRVQRKRALHLNGRAAMDSLEGRFDLEDHVGKLHSDGESSVNEDDGGVELPVDSDRESFAEDGDGDLELPLFEPRRWYTFKLKVVVGSSEFTHGNTGIDGKFASRREAAAVCRNIWLWKYEKFVQTCENVTITFMDRVQTSDPFDPTPLVEFFEN